MKKVLLIATLVWLVSATGYGQPTTFDPSKPFVSVQTKDTVSGFIKEYKAYQSAKKEVDEINNEIKKNNEVLAKFNNDHEWKDFLKWPCIAVVFIAFFWIRNWMKR